VRKYQAALDACMQEVIWNVVHVADSTLPCRYTYLLAHTDLPTCVKCASIHLRTCRRVCYALQAIRCWSVRLQLVKRMWRSAV
jgi:hypothetical protein